MISSLSITSQQGTKAVHALRVQKLKNGLPFMINVEELAGNQCYFEYPDGRISLVAVVHATRKVELLRELSTVEADKLRKRFHFTHLH